MIKVIDPASEIKFYCYSQSFMRTPGEIVSLVETSECEVHLISYNQADDTITTIQNNGKRVNYSDSEDDPEDYPEDDPEDD